MRLNKKGYMLVEIIVAAVIAFSIAYYLLNLTFKFKDKNELIHDSRDLNSIKINVTKNIMNDIKGKDIGFELEDGNIKGLSNNSIEFYVDGNPRKLVINSSEIKYGYYSGDTIKMTKQANDPYYVKNLGNNSYLKFDVDTSLNDYIDVDMVGDDSKLIMISIDIPVVSIYTDEVTHIKLLLQGHNYVKSEIPYMVNVFEYYSFSGALAAVPDEGIISFPEDYDDSRIVLPDNNTDSILELNDKSIKLNNAIDVSEGTTVTIKGNGTIIFESEIENDIIENQGTLILDGVSLIKKSNSGDVISNGDGAKVEIKDGTNITSNSTSGTVISGGNIVMSGGVVNVANAKGIWTNGLLTITGGTINKILTSGESKGAAIDYRGLGTATIKDTTINVVNTESNAIWNGSTGKINIEDVTIDNNLWRCIKNNSTGSIVVFSGNYKCKDYYFVNASEKKFFTVHTSSLTLNSGYGVINGGYSGNFTKVT